MGMERGDSALLAAIALIVVGAIVFGQSIIYVVSLFLPWGTSLWVLMTYGIMLVIAAFALHNQRSLKPKSYGYIATVYITLMASSFYFLQEETQSVTVYSALIGVYAIPAILLLIAWISGKKQHLY